MQSVKIAELWYAESQGESECTRLSTIIIYFNSQRATET